MRPPRLAERILEGLLPPTRAAEALLGDLAEEFGERVGDRGRARAWLWYWWQCISTGWPLLRSGNGTGGGVMGMSRNDLRYAWRSLRRSPGFTAAVVVTLALGLGANTAIYSVIHATLIQGLPYDGGGERLVQIRQPSERTGSDDIGFSVQEIADYRARASTMTEVAEYHGLFFNVSGLGDPLQILAGVVSANFFETLGVEPLYGRLFVADDDRADATPVIVLTYDFWMRRMGGDPTAIGQTLEMNDMSHTVIGVLPPVPLYPAGPDLYIPTHACPLRSGARWMERRTLRAMTLFGRLDEAADIRRLNAELGTIERALHAEYPEAYPQEGGVHTRAIPLREALVQDGRTPFLILFSAAMLVLLISTANVANLTFARLLRRERELRVRLALGAGLLRVARLVLTEGVLVGAAGGVLGLLMASLGLDLLTDFAARYTSRAGEIAIDGGVLGFTLLVAVMTGVASGLIPLLLGLGGRRSRPVGVGGSFTDDGRKRRLQSGLVVGQVALSFVLLLAGGLTLRSLQKRYAVDPGFEQDAVLSMEIPSAIGRTADAAQRFYTDLLTGVRELPNVTSAAAAMTVPLDGLGQMETPVRVEGIEPDPNDPLRADLRTVTGEYFETLGIGIREGRGFTDEDVLDGAPVAIVNQAFVKRVFGGGSPLGRRVSWDGGASWLTVVGVSADVHHYDMERTVELELYQPSMMMMNSLVVRVSVDPTSLVRPITALVQRLDPKQPVKNVSTMGDRRVESLSGDRLITSLLSFFAGLAGLITAVGIGGIVAFTVSQRRRELGIRFALGSSRWGVVAILLRQGLGITVAGLVVGGLIFRLGGRFVESLLFGVTATDASTFVLVAAAFLLVSVLAVLVPARRVTTIDPKEALTGD